MKTKMEKMGKKWVQLLNPLSQNLAICQFSLKSERKKKLSIFLFENPTGTFAWKGLIYLFFNLIKEQPLNTSNKTTHV